VLAAGAGRRFGGRKMLASWRGAPLVVVAARIALAAPVAGVTVVTGADSDEVAAALDAFGDPRLCTAFNPEWQTGIASSLRCGLQAVPREAVRAVIFLGDMPLVPTTAAARLLAALDEGAPAAFPVVDGAPGHPVAITRDLFAAMARLDGDRGARALLARLPEARQLPFDDAGCVFDLDARP
jgi:molybdenum cofactor cytidylyltransferase